MTDDIDSGSEVESYLVTGKALEKYFELHAALLEFSQLFDYSQDNDRSIAIVGPAFLDTLLEHILVAFLVDDEREVEKLLGVERPLGTYGSRVTTVYCLGFINKIVCDDLRLVGKIRNRFAHDLSASFE